MTQAAPSPSPGLPVTNSAFEPAWVRKGSQRVKDDYRTAQAFEALLVEQMASSLTQSEGLAAAGGEGSEGEGEGTAPSLGGGLSAMLPQALSQGVVQGGGLGLAAQLTRDLAGPAETTAAAGSGAAAGSSAATTTGGAGTAAATETTSGGTSA